MRTGRGNFFWDKKVILLKSAPAGRLGSRRKITSVPDAVSQSLLIFLFFHGLQRFQMVLEDQEIVEKVYKGSGTSPAIKKSIYKSAKIISYFL